jgi:hypothetical protein
VIVFAVDGFEKIKLGWITGVFVSHEQLVQEMLIIEIFAFKFVGKLLVMLLHKLIEILE